MKGATPEDGVQHAGSLIRNGQWAEAKAVLNQIPPTHETYDRYRFEAMIADANKDWVRADSFYEIAAGLTTTPASIYNNWGFSNLNRGNYNRAERLFEDALRYEPSLFTAKNNMAPRPRETTELYTPFDQNDPA
jgi:Tfp pilus assembly protein PilF